MREALSTASSRVVITTALRVAGGMPSSTAPAIQSAGPGLRSRAWLSRSASMCVRSPPRTNVTPLERYSRSWSASKLTMPSIRPGSTCLPAISMRVAPAGIATSGPIASIRP